MHFIRSQPLINRAFKRIACHLTVSPQRVEALVWLKRPLKPSYNVDRYISKCITRSNKTQITKLQPRLCVPKRRQNQTYYNHTSSYSIEIMEEKELVQLLLRCY
jgi:hypothetical protein